MRLVEVDRLDPEPPQRGIQRVAEVPARETDVVGAVAHRKAPLGREHDLAAYLRRLLGEPAPDDLLRGAVAVDVGGVDQGAARLEEGVELRVRYALVGLGAERHRAERQGGHGAAASPKRAVLHGHVLTRTASTKLGSTQR